MEGGLSLLFFPNSPKAIKASIDPFFIFMLNAWYFLPPLVAPVPVSGAFLITCNSTGHS